MTPSWRYQLSLDSLLSQNITQHINLQKQQRWQAAIIDVDNARLRPKLWLQGLDICNTILKDCSLQFKHFSRNVLSTTSSVFKCFQQPWFAKTVIKHLQGFLENAMNSNDSNKSEAHQVWCVLILYVLVLFCYSIIGTVRITRGEGL